jgi:hypothetical protein
MQAVRAIGRCAVSLDKAAEKCVNVLLELIQTKVNYVVQEAICVIKVREVVCGMATKLLFDLFDSPRACIDLQQPECSVTSNAWGCVLWDC